MCMYLWEVASLFARGSLSPGALLKFSTVCHNSQSRQLAGSFSHSDTLSYSDIK